MLPLSLPGRNCLLPSSSPNLNLDYKQFFSLPLSNRPFLSFGHSPTYPNSPTDLPGSPLGLGSSDVFGNNNMSMYERTMFAAASANAATSSEPASVYYDHPSIPSPTMESLVETEQQHEDEDEAGDQEYVNDEEEESLDDDDYDEVQDKKGKRKQTKASASGNKSRSKKRVASTGSKSSSKNSVKNSAVNLQLVPFSQYDPYRDYHSDFKKEGKEPFAITPQNQLFSYYPLIGFTRRRYRGEYLVNGTNYAHNWLLGHIVPVSMDSVKFIQDENTRYADENIAWPNSSIPCIFIGGAYRLPSFLNLDSSIVTPAEKQFLFLTWLVASRNPFVTLSKKYSLLPKKEELKSDIGYTFDPEAGKAIVGYPFAKEHCQLSYWPNICECISFYYGALDKSTNESMPVFLCREGVTMPRFFRILGWTLKTTQPEPIGHAKKCIVDLYQGHSLVDLLSERNPELLSDAIAKCNPQYRAEEYVNLLKLDNEKFVYEVTKSDAGRKTVALLKAYTRYISVQKGWLHPSLLQDENALFSAQFTPCPIFSKAKELLGSSIQG